MFIRALILFFDIFTLGSQSCDQRTLQYTKAMASSGTGNPQTSARATRSPAHCQSERHVQHRREALHPRL